MSGPAIAGMTAMRALGRLPSGTMNRTEAAYDRHLIAEREAGRIVWHAFEAMTFKLAGATRYTPDFMVMRADGLLEAHECKGHWTDDGRVKIKVAAALFPVRFIAVKAKPKRDGGGWDVEVFE